MEFKGNNELPSLEFNEDEGTIKIWGRSTGTEARADFWGPFIDKLDTYLNDPRDIVVTIEMEYFATSSAKAMLEMFSLLSQKVIVINKRKVLVKWISDDEDMEEAGQDYQSMISKLTWKHIKL